MLQSPPQTKNRERSVTFGTRATLQQHSNISLAEATGTDRVQVLTAGTQRLDGEADLIVSVASGDSTLLLPKLRRAVPGKRYWVKRLGTGKFTITASAGEVIDTVSSAEVPAGASFRITPINIPELKLWIIASEAVPVSFAFAQLSGDIEGSGTADTTTTNVLSPDGAGGVAWRAESGGVAKAYAYARQDGENQNDSYGSSRTRFTRASTLHASSGFSGGTSGCRVTYTNAATTNFFATFTGVWQRGGSDTLMTIQVSVNDITVLRCRQVGVNDPRETFALSGILAGVEQNDTIEIYIDDINTSVRSSDWALTLTEI